MFSFKKSSIVRAIYTFLSTKWHFDQITNEIFVHRLMLFGDNISFQLLDKGIIERYGPFGIAFSAHGSTIKSSMFHSGSLFHYLFVIFIALTLFLFYFTNSFFIFDLSATFILIGLSYGLFVYLFETSLVSVR
jgi:hypothetical protein